MTEAKLEAWLEETRSFAPSAEFAEQANAQPSIYADADADPVAYWRTPGRPPDVDEGADQDPRVGPALRQVVQ